MEWTEYLPALLRGAWVTVQLTFWSTILGAILAFAAGIGKTSKIWPIRGLAVVYIEIFRGTSLLVQLFWFFYVLPLFFPDLFDNREVAGLIAGIVALGLNYGAYGAEVVRGALNSVPKGQWEASIALSLSPTRRMFRIIWPQAWAIMLPSLSNLGIMLLKGTAVASVVYMQDITFIGGVLRQRTNDTFFSYGVTMVMYFVIAYVLVLIANALEVRAKRRLGMAPAGTSIFRPSAAKTGVS